MTSKNTPTFNTDLPPDMMEVAATWMIRLREAKSDEQIDASSVNADIQKEFGQWLQADPRHQQAMDETLLIWDTLSEPMDSMSPQAPQPVTAVINHQVYTQNPIEEAVKREECDNEEIQNHQKTVERLTDARRSNSFMRQNGLGLIAASIFIVCLISFFSIEQLERTLFADYKTDVGSLEEIRLEDGSIITLNTDSAVDVVFTSEQRAIRLLDGEVWFDVANDEKRPFIVTTDEASFTVTGTQFGVHQKDSVSAVHLVEGSLRVQTLNADESLNLTAGHGVQVSDIQMSDVFDIDETSSTAWLRGQMVFFETPLNSVINTLNRYHRGHIMVVNEELKGLIVSGVFSTQDPENVISALQSTLNIKVTRVTDYFVLLH